MGFIFLLEKYWKLELNLLVDKFQNKLEMKENVLHHNNANFQVKLLYDLYEKCHIT